MADFPKAKKFMKPTTSDHISVALKKKLLRRMEFTKFKKQFMQERKLRPSMTMNTKLPKSMNEIILSNRHSSGLDLDYLKPIQSIPKPQPKKLAAIEEYGLDKLEELKSDPAIAKHFEDMFSNPNKVLKKVKPAANSKPSFTTPFSTMGISHIKSSDSLNVNKHK